MTMMPGSATPSAKPSRKLPGFTLLEVLAALMVMTVLAVGLSRLNGTSARASRTALEGTALRWEREQLVIAFVQGYRQGQILELPENYEAIISISRNLNNEELERLATSKNLSLQNLQIRTKNPPQLIYEGEVLAPRTTGS